MPGLQEGLVDLAAERPFVLKRGERSDRIGELFVGDDHPVLPGQVEQIGLHDQTLKRLPGELQLFGLGVVELPAQRLGHLPVEVLVAEGVLLLGDRHLPHLGDRSGFGAVLVGSPADESRPDKRDRSDPDRDDQVLVVFLHPCNHVRSALC